MPPSQSTPAVNPFESQAALSHLSLLPFLSLSPCPTVVLRVAPLLDALAHRRVRSSSSSTERSPVWNSSPSTYRPSPAYPSVDPLSRESATPPRRAGEAHDASLGIEHLTVRTPMVRPPGVDDYFSLTKGGGGETAEPKSDWTGSADAQTRTVSGDGSIALPNMSALEPAWKNWAWRDGLQSVDTDPTADSRPATRKPSMSTGSLAPAEPTAAMVAAAAAKNLKEQFAKLSDGRSERDQRDRATRERLGTVLEGLEEDDDGEDGTDESMVTDDFEPETEVETWRASWSFLSTAEQDTLFDFLLDFLEDSQPSPSTAVPSPQDLRRGSVVPSDFDQTPNSSTASLFPEHDEPTPSSVNPVLRLPGLVFTAVLLPPARPSPDSSDDQVTTITSEFLILSTPPLLDPSHRMSEPRHVERHASTSSNLSASTPGPSLGQRRQQQERSDAITRYKASTQLLPESRAFTLPPIVGECDAVDAWTLSLGTTEMARRIRQHPWHKTELGPLTSWSTALRTTVSSILASPFRECILWGEHKLIIYNDEYILTAGRKHPELLGMSARVCWAELWDELEPVANRALSGETVSFHDHFLVMERDGFLEETYHSFTYAPLRDGAAGDVVGILNLSIESTAAVVAARRLATVRDLIQMTSLARTVEDFASSVMKALAKNPYDIPFALLYHVEEVVTKPTTKEVRAGLTKSQRKTIKLTCKGSVGIPHDHPFLVHEAFVDMSPPRSRHSSSSTSTTSGSNATAMDLRDRILEAHNAGPALPNSPLDRAGSPLPSSVRPEWTWPFDDACLNREPVQVDNLGALADRLEVRGWDKPSRSAVVIPVRIDADATTPSAVLVLGVNPMTKHQIDSNPLMKTFFDLLSRHVAIGLFSVLAAEQDRHRAEELLKLDRAKSTFFSSVSHELRTPLTLILGPLEDMLAPAQKRLMPPNQAEKLVLVQKHANRLLNMVNKLLDFSSVEGGRMNFKFRPVQIGALTRDFAILFRDAIERARIKYVIECDDDPPDAWPIYLSPELWEKVIMNTVGNALKYTEKGQIKVSLKSTRGEAVLSISDTGVGIPRTELGKIFNRFHRVQSSTMMTTGTGIGLALTLELVKLIGGQLEVESDFGSGSTFTVRLQRGYAHLPIEQVEHTPEETSMPVYAGRNLSVVEEAAAWRLDALAESPAPSSNQGSTISSQHSGSGSGEDYLNSEDVLSLKGRTVVLVDDSHDLRAYISSLLSTQFTVVPFANPIQALEYMLANPPNLLVTDAMMAGLTGMELTARIRQQPATALLPIIMVSAQSGIEARADALEGGVDDYLVKPFQPRELLARVRVHLQLGLMRVELEKRVEERTRALIESEGRNRALVERYSTLSTVSPVGIVQVDQEGNLVYANPSWFAISGHDPDKPLSEWMDNLVEGDVARMTRLWTTVIAEGQVADLADRQFRFKSGRWAQLELRASTEVGLPTGWVGALTDITRQKEVEELHIRTVEQRAADAEENRRQTEAFLDMSSHELRNPLSGVWQNAEVIAASLEKYVELLDDLRDGEIPPREVIQELHDEMVENVDAVESILLCTAHQGRIADDILNVSKLNMGLLTINPVPFELIPRIVEVKRVFEAECLQKQIDLRLVAGKSVAQLDANWVHADPSRLHQILLNFLSNSIKFTTDISNRKIVIHIEAYAESPPLRPNVMRISPSIESDVPNSVWIAVGVEDNGRGLSEEDLRKLFARFSQANPRSDQYGGSGLGLYISKKLVELHSGFIEVESKVGVGSIFSFAIPAQRASPPEGPSWVPPVPNTMGGGRASKRPLGSPVGDVDRSKKTSKTGPGPSSPAEAAVAGPVVAMEAPPTKVLVVEDNLVNQKILCRQLKNAGYETEVANNGLEALEALERDDKGPRSINICLFDIQMPVMNGIESMIEVRRRQAAGLITRQYPCISITGNARSEQKKECLEAGFDDVLTKPYTFATVQDRIESLKLTA
ncbi:hypothetical protein JCM10212_001327 [Sporobolomyces blumeae]